RDRDDERMMYLASHSRLDTSIKTLFWSAFFRFLEEDGEFIARHPKVRQRSFETGFPIRDADAIKRDCRERNGQKLKGSKRSLLEAISLPKATVMLDGNTIPIATPISVWDRVDVRPGRHRLKFLRGSETREVSIDVRGGEVVCVVANF